NSFFEFIWKFIKYCYKDIPKKTIPPNTTDDNRLLQLVLSLGLLLSLLLLLRLRHNLVLHLKLDEIVVAQLLLGQLSKSNGIQPVGNRALLVLSRINLVPLPVTVHGSNVLSVLQAERLLDVSTSLIGGVDGVEADGAGVLLAVQVV